MLSLNRRVLSLLAITLLAGCGTQPVAPQTLRASAAIGARASLPEVSFPRFAQVDAHMYRGGVPSEADLKTLAKFGIKTDISLMNARVSQEKDTVAAEKLLAEKAGIKFVNISLPWSEEPPAEMVKQFLEIASDPKNQPVFVHCKHGRDRTGTMVGTYRVQFDGYTGLQAFQEMLTFGFKPGDYPYYAKFVQNFKGLAGFKSEQKLISTGSGM